MPSFRSGHRARGNLPIVFYFPWNEPSGGPVLFTAIAKFISRNFGLEVFYTDYDPGLSDEMLAGSSVKKICVTGDDMSINIARPVILVTPIYWADRLPKLHPKSKVLFINWHNLCIPVLQETWGINTFELQKFLELTSETNSVAFCDAAHRAAQEAYGVPAKETYIPIGIDATNEVPPLSEGIGAKLRIAVIGRLVIDKIFSITNLARFFSEYEFPGDKELHIIGDGPEGHLIIDADYPTIKLKRVGSIFGSDLEYYLDQNVDVVFSMGSSILIPAKRGIPSVVVCNEIFDYHDDAFVFLFDSVGAALGWQVHQIRQLGLKHRTLQEILDTLRNGSEYRRAGERCREYIERAHSTSRMAEAFLAAAEGTKLTFERFVDTMSPPSPIGKIRKIPLGPFGSLQYFRRSDKSIAFQTSAGRNVAVLPAKGVKRVVLITSALALTLPIWPVILPIYMVRSVKKVRRRRRKVDDAVLTLLGKANERDDLVAALDRIGRIESSIASIKTQNMTTEQVNNNILVEISTNLVKAIDMISDSSEFRKIESLVEGIRNENKIGRISIGRHTVMDVASDILSDRSYVQFAGDITQEYLSLINGVDDESRAIVTRVLRRLRDFGAGRGNVFQITKREEDEYFALIDFHYNRIMPLHDGWFLYDGRWFLPSAEISSTVFYYNHFINEVDRRHLSGRDVLDVGAHMGDSALVMRQFFAGTIWSFEPSPQNFLKLQSTILRNNLKGVEAVQLALGSNVGTANIIEDGDQSYIGSESKGVSVGVTTIDTFCSANSINVGLIKIDVEGREIDTLKGGIETIKKNKPVLIISIYHNFEQFFGVRKFLEALNLGYTFKYRKPSDLNVIVDLNIICEPGDTDVTSS